MIVGILGLGYWGPNLVRNFLAQSEVSKVIGCDLRPERLKFISERYPSVHLLNDSNELMNGEADIIVIATPVKTHYEAAKKALENGKHIWVEKPFTSTTAEAEELISIADRKNLKIFVDHTFIYNGAVRKMKELVEKTKENKILENSRRLKYGKKEYQIKDVNVIWDLAPHDLSIMNYILPDHEIMAVSANGIANYNGRENLAHLCIHFKENTFAHFHVNWVSPVKIRRMIVGGDKKMLVYDDMENFEKIKVYNSGVDFNTTESIHEALVQYRIGDMFSPIRY